MDLGVIGFAATAGALATMNPCGFVLLPALVGVRLRHGESEGGGTVALGDALAFGLRTTLGFLAVFTVLGVALALGARALIGWFPLAAALVGAGLVLVGAVALFTGRTLLTVPTMSRTFGGRASGAMAFGAAYAIASLSCTLPIFLAVVVGTVPAEGFGSAIVPFTAYAMGMGGVLLAVTLATALSVETVIHTLRRVMPFVERIGSLILIGAGMYLIVYWAPQLRLIT